MDHMVISWSTVPRYSSNWFSKTTVAVSMLNWFFSFYSLCEETQHPVFVKQFQILQWKNRVYGVCASVNLTISGFSMVGMYVFAGSTITDNINYRAFVKLEPNGAAKTTYAERHIVDKLDLTSSVRRVLFPNQFQTNPYVNGLQSGPAYQGFKFSQANYGGRGEIARTSHLLGVIKRYSRP